MKIENLLRENIRNLKPYTSARDEFSGQAMVQLDANENPFDSSLNRYPDPYQRELKQEIARYKGLSAENLMLGNGSDEAIDLLIRAFCEPAIDNVIGLKPSYGMFKVCCDINNVDYREVSLGDEFELDADKVLESIDAQTKMVFICSPNNPTANVFAFDQIQKVLDRFEGIVVMDEAYIDFSDSKSWSKRLNEYPQLVVIQTFSKAFGLAAARLGMVWASTEIIDIMNRIKPPYNVNQLTADRCMKRIQDAATIENEIGAILKQREVLRKSLEALSMVDKVFPSQSNFLLIKCQDSDLYYSELLKKGIVVRDRSNQYNCENCLRISVGTEQENEVLIKALKQIENEESTVYR